MVYHSFKEPDLLPWSGLFCVPVPWCHASSTLSNLTVASMFVDRPDGHVSEYGKGVLSLLRNVCSYRLNKRFLARKRLQQ